MQKIRENVAFISATEKPIFVYSYLSDKRLGSNKQVGWNFS